MVAHGNRLTTWKATIKGETLRLYYHEWRSPPNSQLNLVRMSPHDPCVSRGSCPHKSKSGNTVKTD